MRMLNVVVLILVAIAWPQHAFVSAQESLSEHTQLLLHLADPEVAVRRKAAGELGPARIGYLEPSLAIRGVLQAMNDSDQWVRLNALGGLSVLAAATAGDRGEGPPSPQAQGQAQISKAIESASSLRNALIRIVESDPDFPVVRAASGPLMALYGSDPKVETVLLDRADKVQSPVDRATLMMQLAVGGLDSEATVVRVAKYFDDAPLPVQHRAAEILVWTERIPTDRLGDFLRIIESSAYFADPTLVRALPRFNRPASSYLPRLLAVQQRLNTELLKPPEERTVTIYNDEFVRRALQETITGAQASGDAR